VRVYKLDNYTHLQHAAQKVNNYVNGCDTLLRRDIYYQNESVLH